MKKIKLFIIPMLLVLITGCDFNYELEINKDGIIEKNTAFFNADEIIDDDINKTVLETSSKYFINDDHLIANETNILKDKNGYQTINNYKLNEINNLKSLNLCYDSIEVISMKTKVGLKSSNRFNCFDYYDELENVTIHLKSNFKCIECNADEVIDNDYYWYINRDNSNKQITAVFSKKLLDDRLEFIIVCAVITIIAISAIVILFLKQKKANKI